MIFYYHHLIKDILIESFKSVTVAISNIKANELLDLHTVKGKPGVIVGTSTKKKFKTYSQMYKLSS